MRRRCGDRHNSARERHVSDSASDRGTIDSGDIHLIAWKKPMRRRRGNGGDPRRVLIIQSDGRYRTADLGNARTLNLRLVADRQAMRRGRCRGNHIVGARK